MATVVVAQAQEKVTFRYNPTIGEKISYRSIMNMDVEADQSMIMDIIMKLSQTATEKDASNVYSVSAQIEAIKVDMNMGVMMASYDSENPDANDMIAQQLSQQFGSILNKDIDLKMNEKAEIIDVSGIEAFQGIGDLKSMFSTATFPEHALAVGESWDMSVANPQMGMEVKYIMTYAGKENGLIRVDVTADSSAQTEGGSMTVSGHNLYDPTSFILIKSDITVIMEAPGATMTNKALMEKI